MRLIDTPLPGKPSQSSEARTAAPARALAAPSAPTAAQALALQRSAGNRATGKVLARWAAHPDKDKKGALVPDVVAADYLRFNPPKNQ
jgi:hypothetical protein